MSDYLDDFPRPKAVFPGDPVMSATELSDYDIQMIHAGLMIPTAWAIKIMAREIRKWRGVPDPDLI